jgi:hypothetical protein
MDSFQPFEKWALGCLEPYSPVILSLGKVQVQPGKREKTCTAWNSRSVSRDLALPWNCQGFPVPRQ